MIEIKNLSKDYGKIKAIKNLNFTVNKGEIMGFLGPNGAGKSTTMKIITGFIPPTEGTVIIDEMDIMDNDYQTKRKIGYLPENPPLYNDMTVKAYLKFVGEIKGLKKADLNARVNEVLGMLGIEDVANRLIRNLSKGYKQRIGLAQAIISDPDVLVLDEPTIGLDPAQIIEIRDLIKKLGKDRTIILSSHILPEVSQICERVAIINKGEIIAIDTPDNLSKKLKESNVIETRIIGEQEKVIEAIKKIKGVTGVEAIGEKEKGSIDYRIEADSQTDLRQDLFKVMSDNKANIIELKTVDLSLEDVFLQLMTNEAEVTEDKEEVENKEEKASGKEAEIKEDKEEKEEEIHE
ncbi:MAG: ATP-binding cassette domain-containing protein [Bacteroidota bacterium]|nr:ATP-binding cassette domain-containing protein [Bacteroidota bacterium]